MRLPFIERPKLQDLFASVVVFLVALPLCMGIALASGLPPAAGLITGMVGGLLVGALAGAPLQVSGPAAGLTVLVFATVQEHGVATLGVIVMMAGLMQLVAGLLRSGRLFQAVPPSVIAGMLAGIGVLIIAGQLHVMMGAAPKGTGLANLVRLPASFMEALGRGRSGLLALGLGALVIGVMALWPALGRRVPRLRLLPSALVAVVVASALAAWLRADVAYVTLPESLLGAVSLPTWQGLSAVLDPAVVGAAMAIAVIASAETLLCATAVDRMHTGPRTDYDRELVAQGAGNLLCGVLGALPLTGVIVRSSANVEAGGKTRWAAMLHGAWLLLFVAAAPFLLKLIPIAALAGLLVFTGYKLVRQDTRSLARGGRFEIGIFVITVGAIVSTDLLKGVLFGLGLAVARLLWTMTHLEIQVTHGAARSDLHLLGSATFVRLPELMARLQEVPRGSEVHVHLDRLDYIDHAGVEALSAWAKQHAATGGRPSVDWQELELRSAPAPRRQPRLGSGPDNTLPNATAAERRLDA